MKTVALCFSLACCGLVAAQNPYDVKSSPSGVAPAVKADSGIVANFPYYHMADWKAGMRFMCIPGFDATSNMSLSPYKTKDTYGSRLLQKNFAWKVFTVVELEERERKCPRGTCKTAYVIFDCEGKKYEYEYIVGGIKEMRASDVFTNVDGLVYLDEVDKAKSLFLDSSLYVMTDMWLRDEVDHERYQKDCPKFVRVNIVKVGVGKADGPVKIVFKADGLPEAHLNVRFSGTNKGSGVFGIDFDKAFSLKDPRGKYPKISNAHWSLIQQSKVEIGMSDEACRLAWGDPSSINRGISTYGASEQWVYAGGYLYFDGKKLVYIQN